MGRFWDGQGEGGWSCGGKYGLGGAFDDVGMVGMMVGVMWAEVGREEGGIGGAQMEEILRSGVRGTCFTTVE